MESETQRTARLQAMQMADLGTARREHVSTVDKHSHFENVKLSELEAHRQSNIPGTLAYKQAQKHKDGLQDLHKTVSDETQIDTQLDDMMHGQSHRAQLNEQLHGSAKPTVPISSIKKSPHLPKQAFAVNRSTNEVIKNHPLPPRQSGRGGGVIGGRGRGNFSPKVNTGSRVSLGPIPTGKDPALDRNNVSPPVRGRGISKRGGSSSRGSLMRGITRSPRGVSPRDDTPLCQHFNKIVTPQQFMAQVRWASNFGAISQQETASPLQEKVGILAKQVEVVPKKEEPLTPLKAIHEIPTSLQVPKEAISPLKRKIGAVAKQVEVLPKKKESLASVKAIHEEPEISSDSTGSEVLLDIGAEIKFEPSLDLFSSPSLADLDGLDFGKQPGNPASLASGIIEPPQKEEEMDKFAEVFARIFETMPGLKEKIDSKLKLSPTTPPQAAFQEYRSRATTASSTDSSGEKPYEVDVRASPKNLVPHEGIKGFGALRLTESSSQNSDSKKPTGGLTQSIYASAAPRANFRGHSRENSSVVARPAPRPARTIGPQPYNPLAARAGNTQNTTPELQTVIPKGVEELKPRIRTIGPPPWQGSKKA
ncbi:hypothetical protein N7466_001920 [Penicillium verhagenii]|uniref:uncharacterized protein n=1 Tax=Penicillium verhagenii TaxID=1562060 RepID=UPI0025458473|nr:uncharacterized protein N7466_001920 [Penicillium verhagenii]KAJ5938786.1 hypothetical protein N7466_001920 [Penicillium verhagenii]